MEAAGVETTATAENKRFPDEPRADGPSRGDVSARSPVATGPSTGPSSEATADPIQANGDNPVMVAEPVLAGKADDPRAALLGALATAIAQASAAGDLEAARVAHEALGRLLGSQATGPARVVDLAAARARKGGAS